jgi:hypothetical protein
VSGPREEARILFGLKGTTMFLALAILLAVAYVVALIVVHTAPIFIHILIVLAVISLVFHLLRGRTA